MKEDNKRINNNSIANKNDIQNITLIDYNNKINELENKIKNLE